MPIVGMTDRESLRPRFPSLGKLRKGDKKPASGPGKDLDYFRFTSDRPEIEAAFRAAYKDTPKEINVYLPHATLEENFPTWMEEWEAGGLVHRCDGITMSLWRNAAGGYDKGERPCPYANGSKSRTKEHPGCARVGRLEVIIPELLQAGYVGTVTLETHSANDAISISASLVEAESKRSNTELGLRGIRYVLRRVPELISTPDWDGGTGRRRVKKNLVKIEPEAEWVREMMKQEAALAVPDEQRAISDASEALGNHDVDDDVIDGEARVITPAQTTTTPTNGNGHDASATEFKSIPNATDERAALVRYGADGKPVCPECGGPMWDNAQRKAEGKIKPNAPDFKCKDKNCEGVYWPGQAEAHPPATPRQEPATTAQPAPHGITDPAEQAALKKMCTDNGLKWEVIIPEVIRARRFADYAGTFEDAKAALQQRITAIIDAQAQAQDATLFEGA